MNLIHHVCLYLCLCLSISIDTDIYHKRQKNQNILSEAFTYLYSMYVITLLKYLLSISDMTDEDNVFMKNVNAKYFLMVGVVD